MKCDYSREILALYIEDDLPALRAEKVKRHVSACGDCQLTCEQLQRSQSFIKSRLKSHCQTSVTPETLAGVRRAVLSKIGNSQEVLGWAVTIERALMLGFRRRSYVFASLAIVAIVSVSLLAQMRDRVSEANVSAAVFDGRDILLRPEGYREWVFVGNSTGINHTGSYHIASRPTPESFRNVYINRSSYREYVKTGKFPEGTVMVLELAGPEMRKEPNLQGSYDKNFALEVSVKDSDRFAGGWGFFDFTDTDGKIKPNAQALPDASGCRSCHEERAETDHVFTQFYPVLRSARFNAA